MPIKRLKATDTGPDYEFTVWLDDSRLVPDAARVLTLTGEPQAARAWAEANGAEVLSVDGATVTVLPDPAAKVPDPAFVRVFRMGKQGGDGKPLSPEQAWANVREEAETQAGHAATSGQELVLKDDPESSGDRAAREER